LFEEGTILDSKEGFLEKTLGNLSRAWQEVSQSASRSLGLAKRDRGSDDREALRAQMSECLEARGGEVAARFRAAELGRSYLERDSDGRALFLKVLAQDFACDLEAVRQKIGEFEKAVDSWEEQQAAEALRQAAMPPRLKLLTQFNALPEGVKFLVNMRADLLEMERDSQALKGLDRDLRELLVSWFDPGFLDLAPITWDSPAALLEKLIAYEAVHEITSWEDLRNRVDSDRRLFALFHPRMADEPLAFVEVALAKGISRRIQPLLDVDAPRIDSREMDTAIFYSISNTQKGLRGVSFGEYLIKQVVKRLAKEVPNIKDFATLSPIPGFMAWLRGLTGEDLTDLLDRSDRASLTAIASEFVKTAERPEDADEGSEAGSEAGGDGGLMALLDDPNWTEQGEVARRLELPLSRLCFQYLLTRRPDGRPIDSVARFHLRNGARLEQINWLADRSAPGLQRSAGLMVNYRYLPDDMESNHETYMAENLVSLGPQAKTLAKGVKERGNGKGYR
jgi:malonyl-CoA decarboxylase